MRFLKLGQDMTFYSATPDRVMVHFKIKDMEAVEQFLKDEDLIKFLNDPQTDDENSGCRLTVSRHGEIVTFQRQFETYTIKEEACADLLASLKTYVIPAGQTVIPLATLVCSGVCLLIKLKKMCRSLPVKYQ